MKAIARKKYKFFALTYYQELILFVHSAIFFLDFPVVGLEALSVSVTFLENSRFPNWFLPEQ
jgi:hypothetical protein